MVRPAHHVQIDGKFLFILAFVAFFSCGGSDTGGDDDADDCTTDDDCSTGEVCTSGSCVTDGGGGDTACSNDGSDEQAVGTYSFQESDGDTQYRIFRSDCTYCSQTLEDDEDSADEDGEWTSEFTNSPELAITAGGLTYNLSSNGLVLTNDAFDLTFTKDTAPNVTCGGETAQ